MVIGDAGGGRRWLANAAGYISRAACLFGERTE